MTPDHTARHSVARGGFDRNGRKAKVGAFFPCLPVIPDSMDDAVVKCTAPGANPRKTVRLEGVELIFPGGPEVRVSTFRTAPTHR